VSTHSVDLLVLGGGMAGLTAAARAAQSGASVVLVEKAPRTDGSALYAGFIWTAPTREVMRRINPDGDPELAGRLVDGYPAAMDWVRSLGVDVRSPVTVLGYGQGCQTDMPQLLAACERPLRDASGCEIRLDTAPERLLVHDGRVCGAEVVSAVGRRSRIEARSTLLATGGFGGDPELRERHIHPLARDLPLRANQLIDAHARTLDDRGNPIPGLLAAGADSGGLWHRAYAGGIATALVFGLQAAETALSAGSSSAPLASSRSTS
jgi:succinate dehydrogenase/fumarate reductase flavoprotein subunit